MEKIIAAIALHIDSRLAQSLCMYYGLPASMSHSGQKLLTEMARTNMISPTNLSALITFFTQQHHNVLASRCRQIQINGVDNSAAEKVLADAIQ